MIISGVSLIGSFFGGSFIRDVAGEGAGVGVSRTAFSITVGLLSRFSISDPQKEQRLPAGVSILHFGHLTNFVPIFMILAAGARSVPHDSRSFQGARTLLTSFLRLLSWCFAFLL